MQTPPAATECPCMAAIDVGAACLAAPRSTYQC
jgi:hypothetical protein